MAAIAEMGEIEEINSKDEGSNIITNGDISNDVDMENQDSQDSVKKIVVNPPEPMDTDNNSDTKDKEETEDSNDVNEDDIEDEEIVNNDVQTPAGDENVSEENNPSPNIRSPENNPIEANESQSEENEVRSEELMDESSQETKASEEQTEDEEVVTSKITDKVNDDKHVDENSKQSTEGSETSIKKYEDNFIKEKVVEIHEIDSDDDEDVSKVSDPIELNDSGGEDEDGDVMFVDTPKENGTTEIIDLETPEKKIKEEKPFESITPRRSTRNLNKSKSYAESDKEDSDTEKARKQEKEKMMMMVGLEERLPMPTTTSTAANASAAASAAAAAASASEESDIEEILPQDPLACNDSITVERILLEKSKPAVKKTPIVVNDTKRLVEIASKSNSSSNNIPQGTKKEPTLVIIDTNSILSGRGPMPVNKNTSANPISNTSAYQTVLPMALPAQGMYPPNMRATITPIPVNPPSQSILTSSQPAKLSPATITPAQTNPLLPSLTDDMFVVEAPSFIVPYVYEKPPVKDFKEFVKEIEEQLKEKEKKPVDDADKKKRKGDGETNDDDASEEEEKTEVVEEHLKKEAKTDPNYVPETKKDLDDAKKPYSYFDSPLGKFFINIGFNLVQEYVQNDLLKQQKRKHSREGGSNPETEKTIKSLVKNLAYSKENNEPFKMPLKKCEFCNFKTESALAMSYHLETPHMKNFVYKCNFCPYEVRSPHDILFHMEAEHAVRGHLERAPAFHQCPNCPFEDNQKGKLSRHLVTCMKKFKPERNLEPPVDWEPPAKIPRVPKMRQQGLNATAAAYQALSKNTQFQFLSKMQLHSAQNALNRGRGRPTLGTNPNMKPQGGALVRPPGMVFKQQAMSGGGSVLVPTNYQLSGNQVFQVVGGQEISGRLGNPGHVFLPNVPSASSTSLALQNQSSSGATKKPAQQPSISITPLPRNTSSSTTVTPVSSGGAKPGDTTSKNSFVICEICDGYIKDLEQLRNHMQWIHKIKIHPKMIYNRPPLNCQKCQFRFFTDQGLERHLLGSHGLVTSSMQDAANKSKDSGRCPVCGRVYQWKLLNHVARDHSMTLKPAHLSYKCTVCTATFGMYKQFENHVYSAHSVVAKRVMDKKGTTTTTTTTTSSTTSKSTSSSSDQLKPLKINDEITIIPQPAKSSTSSLSANGKEEKSSPGTSKNSEVTSSGGSSRAERLARRKATDED